MSDLADSLIASHLLQKICT